jgi:DNA-binding CsgD family transcriptional regulator
MEAVFFLLCISALAGTLEQSGMHIHPVLYIVCNCILCVFFTPVLAECVFDITGYRGLPVVSVFPRIYGIICLIVYMVFFLSGRMPSGALILNILALWIPSAAAVVWSLFHYKKFSSGTWQKGKKIALLLASGNIAFFIAGLYIKFFSVSMPYVFILSFSVLVLFEVFVSCASVQYPCTGDAVNISEWTSLYGLSERESEVLCKVLAGRSNRETADDLYISVKTVETHMSSIFRKTGTKNRFELFTKLSR